MIKAVIEARIVKGVMACDVSPVAMFWIVMWCGIADFCRRGRIGRTVGQSPR